MFRQVRTTGERRAIAAASAEGIKVRGKRGKKRLPHAWDDIKVVPDRSWKRHRRFQYKAA